MRILIAIPALDRDAIHFNQFYSRLKPSLEESMDEIDLMILTREQDTEIQRCWQEVPRTQIVLFENYEIDARHNLSALVKKRNAALESAERNEYDALWFLDSDTGVNPDTLELLKLSLNKGADISVAPYIIRDLKRAIVGIVIPQGDDLIVEGILDPHLFETSDIHFPIAMGPFGCTMIKKGCFSIRCNVRMISGFINGVQQSFNAEDIGFFVNAYYDGKKVFCLSKHLVEHMG